ncbi:alanine racemase [Candidatus Parcubacteria bacterium]|nr:MAG: alanine racemase [Candidatus Parcubacteria bacterium]
MTKSFDELDVRTWIQIDRRSLFFNLRQFTKRARPATIMAVIKSNAYGHGLSLVAGLLAKENPKRWLGVDSITEALRLRRDGIKNPILVLGYTLPGRYAEAARRDITLAVSHFEALRALARARPRPAFHLKIDTGMHRHGFSEDQLPGLIARLKRAELKPSGVFSHLAAAGNRAYSKRQMRAFDHAVAALHRAGIRPGLVHFNKTEGILNYPRPHDGLARLGLGLYGYLPEGNQRRVPLRPALSWKTIVAEVKRVQAGESVGYDLTYRFSRDATIAVLPVGYWHGYDRGLSNKSSVLIRGRKAPVRGRVCMDIMMVDITGIPSVRVGDEAVLIGAQGKRRIGADELATRIGTSVHEILPRINPLMRRVAI